MQKDIPLDKRDTKLFNLLSSMYNFAEHLIYNSNSSYDSGIKHSLRIDYNIRKMEEEFIKTEN